MTCTDEFEHLLRNGSTVIVSAEAEVMRDEYGVAWIHDLEVGYAIRDTKHYADAVTCLKNEQGTILARIEDRLVETHDENLKENAS